MRLNNRLPPPLDPHFPVSVFLTKVPQEIWRSNILVFFTKKDLGLLRLSCKWFKELIQIYWKQWIPIDQYENCGKMYEHLDWELSIYGIKVSPTHFISVLKVPSSSNLIPSTFGSSFLFSSSPTSNPFSSYHKSNIGRMTFDNTGRIEILNNSPTSLNSASSPSTTSLLNSMLNSPTNSSVSIKRLHMVGKKIKEEGFCFLPNDLKGLDLSWCKQITDKEIISIPSSLLILNLQGCEQLTDEGLSFLSALRFLQELNLSWCPNLTDQVLKWISSSTNLLSLSVVRCRQIHDDGLRFLPPNLTQLNFAGCSEISNEGLKFLPSSLLELNLSGCKRITDIGLNIIPAFNLVDLNLRYCDEITNEALYNLSSAGTLTRLILLGCKKVSCYCLQTFKSLRDLNFRYCKEMNNEELLILPTSLTSLSLANCDITDEGLKNLPPYLNQLYLQKFNKITNEGILTNLPPSLTKLNLRNCEKISSGGLKNLPLKELSINYV